MGFPTGVELHNGKIRITFTYRGIRCREVLRGWAATSGNVKKAGNLRAMIVSEIQMGKFSYADHFPESKALRKFSTTKRINTFSELCDLFTDAKQFEISAASMQTLASNVNTLLREIGRNTTISEIQHADLLNYRKQLLTGDVVNPAMPQLNKQGRSPSTVNMLMRVLVEMLKLANRSQFITHSPWEGLSYLKTSKTDPDPLTLEEYQSMLATMPEKHRPIWILAVHTGMRHGELCALSWGDIDLNKGEIHVSRNLTNKGLFVPPKTDAGIRTITLLKPALEALKKQFLCTGHLDQKEIVFHHREHGKTEKQSLRFVFVPQKSKVKKPHFSKSAISYGWKVGMERAKNRTRDPYQSRHTYACWSLSAGANPSFIASQMGHEDARMVYEVYSKWIGDMNSDQVDMLNSRMPTAMPPGCPKAKYLLKKVL